MGLIINDKIDTLMKGYPTVSDKYNVRGGTLASTSGEGHFGDLVKYNGDGFFTVVDSANTIAKETDIAGVLLATNVKLVTDFFGGSTAEAVTRPGEAFNLMLSGYVALPLDTKVTDLTTVKEGLACHVTTDGKVTTQSSGIATTTLVFTGVTFKTDSGEVLAEVEVKHVGV